MKLGNIVYLKTDTEQKPRQVTGVISRQVGRTYEVSTGDYRSEHYEFELTEEKDILMTL